MFAKRPVADFNRLAVTFDRSSAATSKLVSAVGSSVNLFGEGYSMRKQVIQMILIVGLLCAPAIAQRVEIFGGAQFQHLQSSYNAVGWNASLTGNFKHVLGITGDFSGAYNSHRANSSVYTYTVGPVLTARLPVIQPFVHALFGGATLSSSGVSVEKPRCTTRSLSLLVSCLFGSLFLQVRFMQLQSAKFAYS